MALPTASCHDVHCGGLVTGRAIQVGMSFDKAESCFGVIEFGIGPLCRLMAGVALFTITPLMVVFDAVTSNATAIERVLEVLALMTIIALQAGVRLG